MLVKKCSRCKVKKSVDEFSRSRCRKDGRVPYCKECASSIYKARYYSDVEAARKKALARTKRYQANNKERHLELARKAKAARREEISRRESLRRQRPDVKEKHRNYMREYRANNRSRMSAYQKSFKARRKGAIGNFTFEQLQARIEYYGAKCWICSAPYAAIDHVKPVTKGGWNWPANLRPICTPCNSRKNNKWPFKPSDILATA